MSADIFTAAWAEAEASNPPGVETYNTIELIHPAFIEGGVPFSVRAVTGVASDMSFTLEAGAPLNSGEEVVFKAINFQADHPSYAEGQVPQCQLSVDNVGEEVMPYLETAVGTRANLVAIWRQWRSDDLSEPCYGPIKFSVKKVTASNTQLTGTAMLDNLANMKFPNLLFTLHDFPGLLNG